MPKPDKSEKFLTFMKENNIKLKQRTYTHFITMYDKLCNYDRLFQIYDETKLYNIKLLSIDYITLINSFFKEGSKEKITKLFQDIENNDIYFNNSKIISLKDIKLLGKHNLSNILSAIIVAKILKVSNKDICKVVNNFKGIEYRLEYKCKLKNLEIFSKSIFFCCTLLFPSVNKYKLYFFSLFKIILASFLNLIFLYEYLYIDRHFFTF